MDPDRGESLGLLRSHRPAGRTTRYEYMADMARIDRLSAPDISDRAYTVTASFEADRDTQGVILAWGSLFGGFVI